MKFMLDWDLRSKVLIAAGIAIIAGFGITIAVIAFDIYTSAREMGLQRAREQAEAYAKQVDHQFKVAYEVPKQLAAAIGAAKTVAPPDRKTVNTILEKLLHDFSEGIGIWMLWEPNAFDGKDDQYRLDWPHHDPSGRYTPYFTRNGDTIKQDIMIGDPEKRKAFERFKNNLTAYKPPYEESGWGDFYLSPKKRNRDTVTEPFYYEVQGKKVLETSLAVAMRDKVGEFVGVSAVDLSLDSLQKIIGGYKPFGVGSVELISNGGLYVVSTDKALQGTPIKPEYLPKDSFDSLKEGKSIEFTRDGILHVWQPVQVGDTGQNWAVGVLIPLEAITAAATSARNHAIIIGIIATVVIILLLGSLLTALIRPLAKLADAMNILASGQGDLTRRLNIGTNDEIGRTSQAFNKFMSNLREMFVEVKERSISVGEATQRLHEITAKVDKATDAQAEAASATAASVEEVTVSIQHIADTAKDFERTAHETGKATANGQILVTNVANEIAKVNERVTQLSGTMDNLGDQSKQVNMIVQVIKDIADQTNLLALNAAIEAARAGDMGRGFAVVADEVRKLAARTSEATIEIGGIVTAIQNDISSALSTMESTSKQVDSGVELSNQAAKSIGSVRGDTENLVGRVEEIASATKEQAAASTDIAKNIEHISIMAQMNSEAVDQATQAVSKLEQEASSLKAIVGRFKL